MTEVYWLNPDDEEEDDFDYEDEHVELESDKNEYDDDDEDDEDEEEAEGAGKSPSPSKSVVSAVEQEEKELESVPAETASVPGQAELEKAVVPASSMPSKKADKKGIPAKKSAAKTPPATAKKAASSSPSPSARRPPGPGAPGSSTAVNPSDVTARLSGRIIAAIIVYLAVGLAVLLLWLAKGTASTDLIGAFALSLLGWLIGAAGVVFQTEKRNT